MAREHDHEVCPQHSGVEGKNKLLIWMLAVLITVGISQAALLLSLKTEVAGFAYRFSAADKGNEEIKEELRDINRRLTRLELGESWLAKATK